MSESKQQHIDRLSTRAMWMKLAFLREQQRETAADTHLLIAKLDYEKAVFDASQAKKNYLAAETEYLEARLEGKDGKEGEIV